MTWDPSARAQVVIGDCSVVMASMPENTFHSIVSDPPYGLSFMGKEWDHGVPGVKFWVEALRVAKPGAWLLAFGGTRTFHRLAVAIEDAGWELRDTMMWVYGSGFPKSLDVSKAVDAEAGAERAVVGTRPGTGTREMCAVENGKGFGPTVSITAPTTDAAKQWAGWGTALKPALEPIILARKPLDGTVASNVRRWGTGGINVDACRVPWAGMSDAAAAAAAAVGFAESRLNGTSSQSLSIGRYAGGENHYHPSELSGRWPANLLHDGSMEVARLMPEGEARFFYCAKASKEDRDEGLRHLPSVAAHDLVDRDEGSAGMDSPRAGAGRTSGRKNIHPTVKPTDLMRWCCRLVTPPGGTVLDPFAGSCSTGKAAILEGFNATMIEMSPEYAAIGNARMEHAIRSYDAQPQLPGMIAHTRATQATLDLTGDNK